MATPTGLSPLTFVLPMTPLPRRVAVSPNARTTYLYLTALPSLGGVGCITGPRDFPCFTTLCQVHTNAKGWGSGGRDDVTQAVAGIE